MTNFYKRFLKDFSSLIALLTKVIKTNVAFTWGDKQEKALNLIEEKLTNVSLLALLILSKTFEIKYVLKEYILGLF